jgi:hypothetical protein
MVAKEFRELRRDRRTVALMIALPVVLLVVFGYAANFKVQNSRPSSSGLAPARQPRCCARRLSTSPRSIPPRASRRRRRGCGTARPWSPW